ncbi:atherin-like [Panicum virgatum]|uniref:atherin-like n=1 Tax=Panicum virgatum TaxID=38727 RepID=UPI0019D6AAB4|nr:atherin-like [Panicum virgatum]
MARVARVPSPTPRSTRIRPDTCRRSPRARFSLPHVRAVPPAPSPPARPRPSGSFPRHLQQRADAAAWPRDSPAPPAPLFPSALRRRPRDFLAPVSSGELAATAPAGPREPLPGELQRLLPTPFVPLLIRGLAPPTARCWPAPACSRIQGDDLPFPTPVRSILTSPAILLRPGFLSDCGAAQRSDPGFWMNAADSLQGTRIILVLNGAGEHLLMCLLSRQVYVFFVFAVFLRT